MQAGCMRCPPTLMDMLTITSRIGEENENLPKRDIDSLILGPFLKKGWNF